MYIFEERFIRTFVYLLKIKGEILFHSSIDVSDRFFFEMKFV